MYALFAGIPFVGHLNPLIRQAAELRRRGWRVAVATARELRPHVEAEAPGLPFTDLGPLGSLAGELRRRQAEASRAAGFIRGTSTIVRGLNAIWPLMYDGMTAALATDRPDIAIADLFSSGAICAADAAGVPCIVNNPDLLAALPVTLLPPADHLPPLFSGRSIHGIGRFDRAVAPVLRRMAATLTSLTVERDLNRLRRSRGLPRIDVRDFLRDRLILVNGAFGLEYPRPLPARVEMVGPMLPEVEPLPAALEAWLASGPPVVYVNLGTLAIAPDTQLAKMTRAFGEAPWRTLWILDGEAQARLPRALPESIRLETWGPPPHAILRHANVRVFVSHCGINSAYESIDAGTPIVGLPMFADQRDMAARVADAGAGVWLDKRRFTAEDLRSAIRRVLDEDAFHASLPPLQAAIRQAGGVRRAADLIMRESRTASK